MMTLCALGIDVDEVFEVCGVPIALDVCIFVDDCVIPTPFLHDGALFDLVVVAFTTEVDGEFAGHAGGCVLIAHFEVADHGVGEVDTQEDGVAVVAFEELLHPRSRC